MGRGREEEVKEDWGWNLSRRNGSETMGFEWAGQWPVMVAAGGLHLLCLENYRRWSLYLRCCPFNPAREYYFICQEIKFRRWSNFSKVTELLRDLELACTQAAILHIRGLQLHPWGKFTKTLGLVAWSQEQSLIHCKDLEFYFILLSHWVLWNTWEVAFDSRILILEFKREIWIL